MTRRIDLAENGENAVVCIADDTGVVVDGLVLVAVVVLVGIVVFFADVVVGILVSVAVVGLVVVAFVDSDGVSVDLVGSCDTWCPWNPWTSTQELGRRCCLDRNER